MFQSTSWVLKVKIKVAQLCWLCDPMDCSSPGSSVHGILQARIRKWIPCPPLGDLPNPGTEPASHVSCTDRRVLYHYHHLGLGPSWSPILTPKWERQWGEAKPGWHTSFSFPGQATGAGPRVDPSSSIQSSNPRTGQCCPWQLRRAQRITAGQIQTTLPGLVPIWSQGSHLFPSVPIRTSGPHYTSLPTSCHPLHWVFRSRSSLRRTNWLRRNAVRMLLPTVSKKRPEKLWGQRVCRGS